MHDRGKSDRLVVPEKPPNNPGRPGAEVVEERGLPKGNTAGETLPGRSAGFEGVKRSGPCAPGGAKGQGCAVHRASAARDRRPTAGGVSGDPPGRGPWGGRRDVAGLWRRSRGEPSGSTRPGPQGRVSSETDSEGVHPEAERAAAAARDRRA